MIVLVFFVSLYLLGSNFVIGFLSNKEGFLVRDQECFKDGVGVNAEEQLLQNQRKLCLVNQLSTAPGTLNNAERRKPIKVASLQPLDVSPRNRCSEKQTFLYFSAIYESICLASSSGGILMRPILASLSLSMWLLKGSV